MDLSVLLPWRPDGGQRDDVFRHLVPLWRATGAQVCIGTDSGEGPFNCAQAQNNAFRQATSDHLVMYGADQLPDAAALDAGLTVDTWRPLYATTSYYSRYDTLTILRGEAPGADYEHVVPFCTGVVALSRQAYLETGGMDERFAGWGAEDAAFRRTLAVLYGEQRPALPTLRCLWHAGEHRRLGDANRRLAEEYDDIANADTMRSYLTTRGSFVW